eukprot:751954-Hanusia_phi.AAC.4
MISFHLRISADNQLAEQESRKEEFDSLPTCWPRTKPEKPLRGGTERRVRGWRRLGKGGEGREEEREQQRRVVVVVVVVVVDDDDVDDNEEEEEEEDKDDEEEDDDEEDEDETIVSSHHVSEGLPISLILEIFWVHTAPEAAEGRKREGRREWRWSGIREEVEWGGGRVADIGGSDGSDEERVTVPADG